MDVLMRRLVMTLNKGNVSRQNRFSRLPEFDGAVERKSYGVVSVRSRDALRSMTAAIAKPSASAITAQKHNSAAMRQSGSPSWLKGVKNSQKRNVITKHSKLKESARRTMPPAQAVLIER